MIPHGYVADRRGAAYRAILAGSDMDMESRCYKDTLSSLVADKSVDISLVDDAVRRVLTKKFELGIGR
jgi:beta-glucosidase